MVGLGRSKWQRPARARSPRAAGRRAGADRARPSITLTTVDSMPSLQGPPSRIMAGTLAELRRDMRRGGWAHPARAVGARRGDGQRCRRQQGAGDRMGRCPERDRIEPGADQIGDAASRPLVQHERQRARPERLGERPCHVVHHRIALGRLESRHMHDQRVEARPLLGGEHLGDGARVERIGAEPVDRLGRKSDDLAASQRLRGLPNGLRRGWNDGHRAISRVTTERSS